MHNAGYVHNDIKPSNLLYNITDDGDIDVRLGDFGISQCVLTRGEGWTPGQSPGYQSPDLQAFHASGELITDPSILQFGDVFALCQTFVDMYERNSNKKTFSRSTKRAMKEMSHHVRLYPGVSVFID